MCNEYLIQKVTKFEKSQLYVDYKEAQLTGCLKKLIIF